MDNYVDIKGFEGYKINRKGEIISYKRVTPRKLKHHIKGNGYIEVTLSDTSILVNLSQFLNAASEISSTEFGIIYSPDLLGSQNRTFFISAVYTTSFCLAKYFYLFNIYKQNDLVFRNINII